MPTSLRAVPLCRAQIPPRPTTSLCPTPFVPRATAHLAARKCPSGRTRMPTVPYANTHLVAREWPHRHTQMPTALHANACLVACRTSRREAIHLAARQRTPSRTRLDVHKCQPCCLNLSLQMRLCRHVTSCQHVSLTTLAFSFCCSSSASSLQEPGQEVAGLIWMSARQS